MFNFFLSDQIHVVLAKATSSPFSFATDLMQKGKEKRRERGRERVPFSHQEPAFIQAKFCILIFMQKSYCGSTILVYSLVYFYSTVCLPNVINLHRLWLILEMYVNARKWSMPPLMLLHFHKVTSDSPFVIFMKFLALSLVIKCG